MYNTIFRYKVSKELQDEMIIFSKLHKYDSKNTFIDSFELWYGKNIELFKKEKCMLNNKGFKGNLKIKIYKSIKYYYIKKDSGIDSDKISNNQKKKEENKKGNKKRFILPNEVIGIIEKYILNYYNDKNNDENDTKNKSIKKSIKPSVLFDEFKQTEIYENIIRQINEQKELNEKELHLKLMKSFKNKYFKCFQK